MLRSITICKLWERSQKLASSKQLQTHFKTKREKGVGTPFPLQYTAECKQPELKIF